MVTKLLEVVLLHEDITQLDEKTSSPWYTPSFSNGGALLLKICVFLSAQILQLVRKRIGSTVNQIIKVCGITITA